MRAKRLVILVLAIAIVSLIGCRGLLPIYNVNQRPVSTGSSESTLDDIRKAILQASVGLGWIMISTGEGQMTARLDIRAHTAIVDIRFDKNSYSITYRSSDNLKAKCPDGGKDCSNPEAIHPNYNQWIKNLEQRIASNLSGI